MIKNLLFDLGGVIIDIKRQNCVDAFEALGLENPDSYFGEYAQTGIFMQIEDGSIDTETFHRELARKLPPHVSSAQIDAAFQQFIIGIPAHRLHALRKLKHDGYNIYLLSNTNPVMWNGIIESEFRKEGLDRQSYFDGMVTSFEARAAKPDPEIFRYTIEKLGINPAETLFFDDSQANVDAAIALGFNAVLVEPGTEFTQYIPEK